MVTNSPLFSPCESCDYLQYFCTVQPSLTTVVVQRAVCLFFHTRDLDSLSGVKNNGNREINPGRRDGGRRRRREGGGCGEQEKNPHFTDQFDRLSGQDFGPDVVSTAGSATDPDPDDKSSEEHEHEQEEEEADPSGVNFRNAHDDIL